jgi:hypothetical protein
MEAGRRALADYQPTEDEQQKLAAYRASRQATKWQKWLDDHPESPIPRTYTPRKPEWTKPHVYWPMREREPDWYAYLGVEEAKRMDHHGGDPQLGFECFNDFTYSPELRSKLREQVNLEIDLMPEMDLIDVFGPRHKKRTTIS